MIKKLISTLLVVSLLALALASVAFAASYGRWSITPGSVRVSNKVKKMDKQEAVVAASEQSPSGLKVWYGLRGPRGLNTVHKNPVSRTQPSAFSIQYKSGKGIVGNEYTLSVQNDSSSSGNVTVSGAWEP